MRRFATLGALAALTACGEPQPERQQAAEPAAVASVGASSTTGPAADAVDRAVGAEPVDRAARANPVACTSQEETIFSCEMPGGKRLAVCAPQMGEAEYRFGGAEPEIVLTGGVLANVPYSGGGEAQIRFANAGTQYIVYSRMVRTNFTEGEPNNPAISDGVVILRDGKFVAIRPCEGGQAEMPVKINAAKRVFAGNYRLFTEETIRGDPEWAR
ncbi:hypothetical protein G6N82_13395 [Altererythrobacter sp. BO-6]|uniref:hypothetical protein n=1 Tax=Altererythrobacter sp. BO-6 TaxID=2604537 RepID=UPI0013E16E61|nr:hypothetical protein [Altererythrobacter sp. BO-6]QIG55010.1 hypothetical protein G6N82_13395 [Altererythrobacter sp. BO-6]